MQIIITRIDLDPYVTPHGFSSMEDFCKKVIMLPYVEDVYHGFPVEIHLKHHVSHEQFKKDCRQLAQNIKSGKPSLSLYVLDRNNQGIHIGNLYCMIEEAKTYLLKRIFNNDDSTMDSIREITYWGKQTDGDGNAVLALFYHSNVGYTREKQIGYIQFE